MSKLHISDNELTQYVVRSLGDSHRETLNAHLSHCLECRARLKEHEILQRRIRYSILEKQKQFTLPSSMTYAAIASRVQGKRRFPPLWVLSLQYGALVVVFLVFVVWIGAIVNQQNNTLQFPPATLPTIVAKILSLPGIKAPSAPANQPVQTITSWSKETLINDFEQGFLDGWLAANQQFGSREIATRVQLSSDGAASQKALQCEFDFNLLPELENPKATCYLPRLPLEDWTEYDTLRFQAKSLVDPSVTIRVYISLATGAESCWNELAVFHTLSSEYQTFTFYLDDPLYATCEDLEHYNHPLIGKDYVRRLHLIFEVDKRISGAVLIDNIWLAKSEP